jgi:RNA polymerase sigma-70 factor (sigma-E family)
MKRPTRTAVRWSAGVRAELGGDLRHQEPGEAAPERAAVVVQATTVQPLEVRLPSADDKFHEYVALRLDRWRRSAYLLCGDWHLADDLVSEAVLRLHRHWKKVIRADNVDAYAQKILTRCWLNERRRAWRKAEHSVADPLPTSYTQDEAILERQPLARLLASLAPRQRAVVILRFYLDHSVEETADILGIAPGTVRSQSSRALEQLRSTEAVTRRGA